MCCPSAIETIDLLSNLIPVVGHRLASCDLEVLTEMVVGISSHPICALGVIVGFIRCMQAMGMSEPGTKSFM